MGVELDRTRARQKEWETGGEEKALLLTREDIAKEKAVVLGAAQLGKVRPSTGRGGRKDLRHSGGEKGADCVILSLACPPNPRISRRCGWDSCSKSWERWRRGVSHKSSKLTTGRPLWLGVSEKNKWRRSSWSSWHGNFFKLKAWIEVLHLITFLSNREKRLASQQNSEMLVVLCLRGLKEIWGLTSYGSFALLSQLWVGKFSK